MNAALLTEYRKARAHQLATWSASNNSGGGAWPGCHASAALKAARMHLNFLQRMKQYTAPTKRRAKH